MPFSQLLQRGTPQIDLPQAETSRKYDIEDDNAQVFYQLLYSRRMGEQCHLFLQIFKINICNIKGITQFLRCLTLADCRLTLNHSY